MKTLAETPYNEEKMKDNKAKSFTKGFVEGVFRHFDKACQYESFADQYELGAFQTPQKTGNCSWRTRFAMLKDILHPVVYRLFRIHLFLDAALRYKGRSTQHVGL